ncbi:uncharacterized protein PFL1_02748 [Pseudozyma flocculosa PF-1]|uniref:Velvet domain-containing protein n=1 Tax=Pseudozyma flocculosa PF-1 TaxID=1277687 RepID=A0A061HAS3_9BASI|nr:uncharacterized protein PFL1_02748 [Pseudozyma flocculosa PF-1]EPQ29529.1 hypothetical protein PFL1_02748 [Pseudozyma flocculosa PF-1]
MELCRFASTIVLAIILATLVPALLDLPQDVEALEDVYRHLAWIDDAPFGISLHDAGHPDVPSPHQSFATQPASDVEVIENDVPDDQLHGAGTAAPIELDSPTSTRKGQFDGPRHPEYPSRPASSVLEEADRDARPLFQAPARIHKVRKSSREAQEDWPISSVPRQVAGNGRPIHYGDAELQVLALDELNTRARDFRPLSGAPRRPSIAIHAPGSPYERRGRTTIQKAASNLLIRKNKGVKTGLFANIDVPGRYTISFGYVLSQPKEGPMLQFDAVALPYEGTMLPRVYIGLVQIIDPPIGLIRSEGFSTALKTRLMQMRILALYEDDRGLLQPGASQGPAGHLGRPAEPEAQ